MSKAKILVAGLSPTWQRVMVFNRLQPGAVNRAMEVHLCVSGKVINVGGALAQTGTAASLLTVVGADDGTAFAEEYARQFGTDAAAEAVFLPTDGRTRTCTTVVDRSVDHVTELVENARPMTAQAIQAFSDSFCQKAPQAEITIVTGSIPAGVSQSVFCRCLEHARRTSSGGLSCVLDLRGPELIEALRLRPLVVKPNREELQMTTGRRAESEAELIGAMRELNARGAEWVVISDGPCAVLATANGQVYRWEPPQRVSLNPIGSGDCLAAGIAHGVSQGMTVEQAVPIGIGWAADNVTTLLPARWKVSPT